MGTKQRLFRSFAVLLVFGAVLFFGAGRVYAADATLLDGTQVNARLKELVTNTAASYETVDETVTAIMWNEQAMNEQDGRINIAQDAENPVYAVLSEDRQTIYLCSAADTIRLTKDSSRLFANFRALKSISTDLMSRLDTSGTGYMQGMFQNCAALSALDLRSFNLQNIGGSTDIADFLSGCSALQTLYTPLNYGYLLEQDGAIVLPGTYRDTDDPDNKTYTALGGTENSPVQHTLVKIDPTADNGGGGGDGFDPTKHSRLHPGPTINQIIRNRLRSGTGTANRSVRRFVWDASALNSGITIHREGLPVYLRISDDESTIYVYSTAETIYADESLRDLFADFDGLEDVSGLLDHINTDNVTDISGMFRGCGRLRSLDLSRLRFPALNRASGVFDGCYLLHRLSSPGGFTGTASIALPKGFYFPYGYGYSSPFYALNAQTEGVTLTRSNPYSGGSGSYNIYTILTGTGGSFSPSSNPITAVENTPYTVSILCNNGYAVDTLRVDGELVNAANSYTFSAASMNMDHSIEASFRQITSTGTDSTANSLQVLVDDQRSWRKSGNPVTAQVTASFQPTGGYYRLLLQDGSEAASFVPTLYDPYGYTVTGATSCAFVLPLPDSYDPRKGQISLSAQQGSSTTTVPYTVSYDQNTAYLHFTTSGLPTISLRYTPLLAADTPASTGTGTAASGTDTSTGTFAGGGAITYESSDADISTGGPNILEDAELFDVSDASDSAQTRDRSGVAAANGAHNGNAADMPRTGDTGAYQVFPFLILALFLAVLAVKISIDIH